MVGTEEITDVAGRGYLKGEEIAACEQSGIATLVRRPYAWPNQAKGYFNKKDFLYIGEDDEYQCPAGERAINRMTSVERDLRLRTTGHRRARVAP